MTARYPLIIRTSGQQGELPTGDTLATSAPTTANASLNLPHGTAPAAPNDGDTWTTSTGLYARINGVTVGPLGAASAPIVIGFILNSGATGTNVCPEMLALRTGSVTKCKVVTKASDGSTDLSFRIKQNGTDVFSSDPTITHGTSGGTVSTFTSLTSSPLAVTVDDVFTLDVLTGTASWQATIILE